MDSRLLDLKKAFDTSSTNGNNALTPQIISKIISEYARIQPAIRNIIPRVSWPTKVYNWAARVTPGVAATINELDTLTVTDGSFTNGQAAMSQFAVLGLLSNFAVSVDQPLVDVKMLAIDGLTKAMLRLEDKTILRGDALNSQNPGLFSAISAGPNGGLIPAAQTADYNLFSNMDILLRSRGFQGGVYVVSPRVYQVIAGASFDRVRFIGVADGAKYGFPLDNNALEINGIPVVFDTYAEVPTAVTSETLTGSGKVFDFANKWVYTIADDNQAGDSWAAPVVKDNGVTKTAGTDYTLSVDADGTTHVNFVNTPVGPVTANYTYGKQNVLLLNLNPECLLVAENQALQLDSDLANPYNQLATPVRMSMFATLAVRNPRAHLYASNVVVPTVANF